MPPTIPILLYHAVGPVPDERMAPFTIARSRFAEHLDVLVDRGLTLLTVSDLVAARETDPAAQLAAVTFDDGFASFAEEAWPELSRRSIPATLYVATGAVSSAPRWLDPIGCSSMAMLDWHEVRRLDREGCEIGAHTVSHPPLDCVDRVTARSEIERSRDELVEHLGRRVRSFAYPHGHFDRRARQLVIDAGFDSACAVRNAWSHGADDRFSLARLTVTADMTADELVTALDGRTVGAAPRRQLLRTRLHRYVRRTRYRRANRSARHETTAA